jgi:hypothetical protein
MSSSRAELNKTYTDGYSATVRQQIATHELGHYIGLGDSAVYSVMNGGPLYPNADDECGVNHVYVSSAWPPTCGY